MGQSDIAKILQENYPKWYSYYDIKKKVDTSENSIRRSLKCLESCDGVQVKIYAIENSKQRWITYYRIKPNGK